MAFMGAMGDLLLWNILYVIFAWMIIAEACLGFAILAVFGLMHIGSWLALFLQDTIKSDSSVCPVLQMDANVRVLNKHQSVADAVECQEVVLQEVFLLFVLSCILLFILHL